MAWKKKDKPKLSESAGQFSAEIGVAKIGYAKLGKERMTWTKQPKPNTMTWTKQPKP